MSRCMQSVEESPVVLLSLWCNVRRLLGRGLVFRASVCTSAHPTPSQILTLRATERPAFSLVRVVEARAHYD